MKLKAKILTLVLALAMLFSVMVIATIPASAGNTKTIYLDLRNSNWRDAGARFQAYTWDGSGNNFVELTDPDADGYFTGEIPASHNMVIFIRHNPSEFSAGTWNGEWGRSGNKSIDGNCYAISGWEAGSGTWSTYNPTYTVAGSEELCVTSWDVTNDSNDMTYNASSGLYEKTFKNVAAGNYEIKVSLNHSWDKSWGFEGGEGNFAIDLASDVCTLTVTWNPSNGYVGYSSNANHTPGVAATCTTAQSCNVCSVEINPAKGHNMQETTAAVAPSCESAGAEAIYTCANGCGKTEGGEVVKATGHDFENTEIDWTVEGDYHIGSCKNDCGATCKEMHAYTDGTCTVCGNEKPASVTYVWQLVTDASNLAANDKIVIISSAVNYALGTTQNNNNRSTASITKSSDGKTITFDDDVQIITLENGGTTGTFFLNVETGYLYASSSSSNQLRTRDSNSSNPTYGEWKITISSNGEASIVANRSGRNTLQCNTSNNPPIFSCYDSAKYGALSIYKYTTVPGGSSEPDCAHANTTESTTPATCGAEGTVTTTCLDCEKVVSIITTPATGEHTGHEEDYVCDVCEGVVPPAADSELTIEQALVLGALYSHNTFTPGKYYISGTITDIAHDTYGNFTISDGVNSIYVYGIYSADGGTLYGSMTTKPVVGDKVTLYGIIGFYSPTIQMKNGWMTEHTTCKHLDLKTEVTEPTCTEGGYTTYTCNNPECGYSYRGDETEATGHEFDDHLDTTCNNGCGHTRTLYTVNFVVPGKFATVDSISSCEAIVLPTIDSIPGYYNAEEYSFAGWVAEEVDGVKNATPLTGEYQPTADVTLHAVFSYEGEGSDSVYTLTNISDISSTDVVVITMTVGSNVYPLLSTNGSSSSPKVTAIAVSNNVITGTVTEGMLWNIVKDSDNKFKIYVNGSEELWLYCTNSNNGVRVGTNADDNNNVFIIDADSGYLYNDKIASEDRYLGVYNNDDWFGDKVVPETKSITIYGKSNAE